ncbi:MAG: lipid-A-disaccharide synthase [Bacillota bacterium]
MLSAGEISGDFYGARLAAALRILSPDLDLIGMGGGLMEKNGVKLIHNPLNHSVVGLVEALKAYPVFRKVLKKLLRALAEEKPDVLVLIDFPGFNMRLGRLANKLGVPVVYFISPSAWAWREKRARRVASWAKAVAAIFPFEAEVYRKAGANVTFVGHPLLDLVKPQRTKEEFCRTFGLDPRRLILGLLPGSRMGEVEILLPIMLEALGLLKKKISSLQAVLPVAPGFDPDVAHAVIDKYACKVTVVENASYDVMTAADFLIAASGTATLEAAILKAPMLIIYKVAPLTAILARLLLRIPFIGLPNIIAGRMVVPEILQERAQAGEIAEKAYEFLSSPQKREEQRKGLSEILPSLGGPGALKRTAELVLSASAGTIPPGRRS